MKKEMKVHYHSYDKDWGNWYSFCRTHINMSKKTLTKDWSKVTCKNCKKRLDSEYDKKFNELKNLRVDMLDAGNTRLKDSI